jgi:hypothetical protein
MIILFTSLAWTLDGLTMTNHKSPVMSQSSRPSDRRQTSYCPRALTADNGIRRQDAVVVFALVLNNDMKAHHKE